MSEERVKAKGLVEELICLHGSSRFRTSFHFFCPQNWCCGRDHCHCHPSCGADHHCWALFRTHHLKSNIPFSLSKTLNWFFSPLFVSITTQSSLCLYIRVLLVLYIDRWAFSFCLIGNFRGSSRNFGLGSL